MELFHDLSGLGGQIAGGTSLLIGVFDGVHRGHQMLIDRARREAARLAAPSLVLTFPHHPLRLLAPPYAPPELTGPEEKARLIAHYGADLIAMIDFTPEFASVGAIEFLENVVAGACRAKAVVCGDDFHFGARGAGDTALLRDEAKRLGYEPFVLPPLMDGHHAVKSTRVRVQLLGGELEEANRLLGHPYTLAGRVVQGERRGRTIGYPTANLDPPAGRLVPAGGVYAVRAQIGGAARSGMMNIGMRPTFGGATRSIEAHFFDFSGDLYGRDLEVAMIARVREEQRFESAEALVAQLRADESACRAILGA